jgi:hypothetical protein
VFWLSRDGDLRAAPSISSNGYNCGAVATETEISRDASQSTSVGGSTRGNEENGRVQSSSDGGGTGAHPAVAPFEVLVAPATSDESNRVTLRLIPIACWKIEDIRFAFDPSFVTPDATVEFQALKDLRESHSQEGPPRPGPQATGRIPQH